VSCKVPYSSFCDNSLQALSAAMKQTCPKVTHVTCRPQEIKNMHRIKPAELQASEADMKLFIPFDVHVYDGLKDTDVNFRFMLEEPPYYPSYLCKYHTSVNCLYTLLLIAVCVVVVILLTALNNYLSNNSSTNNYMMRIVDECSEERRRKLRRIRRSRKRRRSELRRKGSLGKGGRGDGKGRRGGH